MVIRSRECYIAQIRLQSEIQRAYREKVTHEISQRERDMLFDEYKEGIDKCIFTKEFNNAFRLK